MTVEMLQGEAMRRRWKRFWVAALAAVVAIAGCDREGPSSTPDKGSPPSTRGAQREEGARPAETAERRRAQAIEGGPQDGARHNEEHEGSVARDEATEGIRLSRREQENLGLRTEITQIRPIEDVRKLNGVVKPHPDRVAEVTSRVSGRVVNIHVPLGALVKRGDHLLDIQSVELERAELNLIQAENRLALTNVNLERTRKLVERGIAARKELLTLENRHREILNEIESLTRQLGLLGLPLEEIQRVRQERAVTTLHLPAPIGGTIAERNVVLGRQIEPNAPLMKITDTSVMIVEGEAFENILSLLKLGQRVRVVCLAYPNEVFDGKISLIGPAVSQPKRTIPVWAEVTNRRGLLKQDLFAQIFVILGERRKSLSIPAQALINAEGSEFVFVERGGAYVRADLTIGARNDRFVEVLRGLSPGDRVVTDGNRELYAKWLAARGGGPAFPREAD
ncbi:MAG: efflux RND transporter periplasmic adaptor subunit [candidate division NC10 bacterium]|nr:efflux RND transporter periplasmic adaptor subunit [candidate division NC10 bacterium]